MQQMLPCGLLSRMLLVHMLAATSHGRYHWQRKPWWGIWRSAR